MLPARGELRGRMLLYFDPPPRPCFFASPRPFFSQHLLLPGRMKTRHSSLAILVVALWIGQGQSWGGGVSNVLSIEIVCNRAITIQIQRSNYALSLAARRC